MHMSALDKYRDACVHLGRMQERALTLADSNGASCAQLSAARQQLEDAGNAVILARVEIAISRLF